MLLHQRRHAGDCRAGVNHMRRTQVGLADARQGQRHHLALMVALRQRAELVRQIGEQQRAKARVAHDQRVDGILRQLIGDDLLGGGEAAARPSRHQRAAIEAVAGAIGRHEFGAVELRDMALDDDEQVRRLDARVERRFAFTEVRDVDAVTDQSLFGRIETIEGRGREVERVGHWTPGVALSAPGVSAAPAPAGLNGSGHAAFRFPAEDV